MTQVSQSRSRAAADRLLEVADPDLYRRNPFRVTGLATDAASREVRQRRQLVLDTLDLGAGATVNDKRLPLPQPPAAQEVRAAFDELERADHRLVDELFWWWGDPGACGCPEEVHVRHDLAVETHAKALDIEADESVGDLAEWLDLWVDVADAWMDALDHEGFWDHVRHRVRKLSDRRLDESTVDGLRATLPRALLAPQAALAGKSAGLAELLDVWDVGTDVIDDAREAAAAPTYQRIDALLKEIGTLRDRDDDSGAARRALDELAPAAEFLETLVPHERFRRAARLRNQIAVTLNNCALDLSMTYQVLKLELLEHAQKLAVDDNDREIIKGNLDDNLMAATGRFSGLSTADWQSVTNLVRLGLVNEATDKLRQMQTRSMNAQERAQINSLMLRLSRVHQQAYEGHVPAEAPAPHTWLLNVALCLGFVAIMAAVWDDPGWVVMLLTAAFAPTPLVLIYANGYRNFGTPRVFGFLGLVAILGACFTILWMTRFGVAPVLWCLGTFVVSLPVTTSIAKSLANRLDLR